MSTNIESYPFSEPPGKEINRGYVSIVKEFGPDWVIKEFNPLKPDGTPKEESSYERSQGPSHIKELQETQRILSQDFIYGNKLIPTHWVLDSDENGKEKYFALQKRFRGETISEIIQNGDQSLKYNERFKKFFNENPDLRKQMLELMWGTKRALVEMGVFDDFHLGNIAIVKEEGIPPKLKIFDIQNLIRTQRVLYKEPPAPIESRRNVLNKVEKHSSRLEKYENWLGVTEEERSHLDQKFGIGDNKYSTIVKNLLLMKEQLG
jgi:hypothetical protein